jgi:hypothetical protein
MAGPRGARRPPRQTAETGAVTLITQRPQVQILAPAPMSEAVSQKKTVSCLCRQDLSRWAGRRRHPRIASP